MEDTKPEQVVEDRTEEPKKFKVLIHNDDYTSFEFVVKILTSVFHVSEAIAESLAKETHETGKATCGVYPEEIAETKSVRVEIEARKEGFPLRCTYEEE